jgi:hypothetical protein
MAILRVTWLQGQGQEAEGSIRGGFAVSDREDSAYVLRHISASPGNMSRLVVFLKGEVRYDANMPIAAAARIPKDKIASIEWRDRRPPGRPDGDGILVIQKYQDPSSAMILSPAGYSSSPPGQRNFHSETA